MSWMMYDEQKPVFCSVVALVGKEVTKGGVGCITRLTTRDELHDQIQIFGPLPYSHTTHQLYQLAKQVL